MIRRVAGLLVGALLVLGGCGAHGSSADPSTATVGADTRSRLAAGLAVGSPSAAGLIEDSATTLTPVQAAWLPGWQVLDISWVGPNHSRRFYAALSDDGTAVMLAGHPDSFTQMIRSAQVVVDDAAVATDIAVLYLDATREFVRWSYRIDSTSDIQWLPSSEGDPQRVDLETRYSPLVGPATAEPSGTGWSVTAWMVDDRTLVRHRLEIASNGVVDDTPEVVETDIPVPYTL